MIDYVGFSVAFGLLLLFTVVSCKTTFDAIKD